MNKKAQEEIAMDKEQKENEEGETRDDNNNTTQYYDEDGQIGQYFERENASSDSEPLINNELMNITEEEELNISASTIVKKRGTIYCRKLTLLPPGEKLNVEFDEDGVVIGENASLFSFFLGQQVRNKSVCPIQVKGWNEYTSEILDHLCIQEKWSFDDPEQRRECVMKHAQRLFRFARSKLKRKYFSKLTTKEERLKNKPSHMTKVEWKFLVDYWSNDTVMEKSKKASESRAHQKMPHYNGTKSFGRARQEIRKKNGGKCSRVDLLLASRTRKSEKVVNVITLENNTRAVDEINKLKEQRDQGLNEKTDEQIIQDVLGKDTHGYLKAYGPGRSITQHFKVKPSRLDLSEEVNEVKKKANQAIEEAKKDAENARIEAEQAKIEAEQAQKEAEAIRNDVDKKIAENNEVWEKKFSQLLDFFEAGGSLNNDDSGSEGASKVK